MGRGTFDGLALVESRPYAPKRVARHPTPPNSRDRGHHAVHGCVVLARVAGIVFGARKDRRPCSNCRTMRFANPETTPETTARGCGISNARFELHSCKACEGISHQQNRQYVVTCLKARRALLLSVPAWSEQRRNTGSVENRCPRRRPTPLRSGCGSDVRRLVG